MRRLGALCIFLQHIDQGAATEYRLEFISLLLSFPCFHVSNFFFALAYRLNQRRLLHLRIRQGGLRREDLLVQLDGLFEDLRSVPQTHHSLDVALGRLGGLRGGKVRAERLAPEKRREIARAAAR